MQNIATRGKDGKKRGNVYLKIVSVVKVIQTNSLSVADIMEQLGLRGGMIVLESVILIRQWVKAMLRVCILISQQPRANCISSPPRVLNF